MMEKENTFIGKDDLIHCSVCKEPKQAWLPENDLLGVRLRYRQCACERDANAIEKAEQEEKERRVQIAKNRQNCFDEATMKNKTFANTEEMTPAICKAKKYVDNWDETAIKRALILGTIRYRKNLCSSLHCQCPFGKERHCKNDKL